jgi:hypothetical protein
MRAKGVGFPPDRYWTQGVKTSKTARFICFLTAHDTAAQAAETLENSGSSAIRVPTDRGLQDC